MPTVPRIPVPRIHAKLRLMEHSWQAGPAPRGRAPGGRMASNDSTPNMPRLEMVKVPLLYSSGDSCLARARLTCEGEGWQGKKGGS